MVSYPKEKMRHYQKQHYQKNKAVYVERARTYNQKKVCQHRLLILEYKLSHPCVDCGEKDPIVLDFDHRDRSKKLFNIGDCTRNYQRSTEKLLAEIEKCDIRCSNCHRRKTHRERSTVPKIP